jgi:leucyl aminopeptidase
MLDIAFAKPALPKSGALALLVHEGEKPSGLWAQLDEITGGAIARAFAVAEFTGGKGKTCVILAPGANLTRVLAVGLGKPGETTQRILEDAGGAVASGLFRETTVAVTHAALTPQQLGQVALGAALRSYRFDRYRTKEKPEEKPKLSKLTILTPEVPKAKTAWEPLEATAQGVFVTRDLVSEPPNVLDPPEMADR